MAKELKSWALFGPPTGKTWNPTDRRKEKYPEIKALVTNPWTVLGTMAPPRMSARKLRSLPRRRLRRRAWARANGGGSADDSLRPAWRGTLLPQSDGDIWLAIAFADYERLVATESAAVKKGD